MNIQTTGRREEIQKRIGKNAAKGSRNEKVIRRAGGRTIERRWRLHSQTGANGFMRIRRQAPGEMDVPATA